MLIQVTVSHDSSWRTASTDSEDGLKRREVTAGRGGGGQAADRKQKQEIVSTFLATIFLRTKP